MLRERKLRRWEQWPHVVTLPRDAHDVEFNRRYRIASQRAVLNVWQGAPNQVRSREPFILAVYTPTRGTRLIGSKLDYHLEKLNG